MTKLHAGPAPSHFPPRDHLRPKAKALRDWRAFVRPKLRARSVPLDELIPAYVRELEGLGRSGHDIGDTWRAVCSRAFGEMHPRDLAPEMIEAWLMSLKAASYAPNTMRKHFALLRGLLDFARKVGMVEVNPSRLVGPEMLPSKRPVDEGRGAAEVLSLASIQRIISSESIPFERRLIWAVLLLTGVRFGEVAALRWGDYTATKEPLGELVIQRSWSTVEGETKPTKNKRTRRVPVHPVLAKVLADGREAQGSPGDDALILGRQWNEGPALAQWRRDLKTIGVPGLPPKMRLHGARHSFISRLLSDGAEESIVERLTHVPSQRSAFGVYSHVDWPALCRAVLVLKLKAPGPWQRCPPVRSMPVACPDPERRGRIVAGLKEGRSAKQIAAELGIDPVTVRGHARRAGLEPGTVAHPLGTRALKEQAQAMMEAGRDPREVAIEVGVSASSCYRWRR